MTTLTTENDATAAPLALPQELTIYQVGDLRTVWLSHLRDLPPQTVALHVDGGAVQDVDGAGVQLLCALRRSALQEGLDFVLDPSSPPLMRALCALGIQTHWSQL